MAEITIANAVNLALIIVFITVLIKMFEKVTRRSQNRIVDTTNAIIEQIKNYVIEFNLKKDLEVQQDAVEHQKMQNERKLLQLPGVRRSQVTTSQSNVNMSNPTRLESRMEKQTIDIEGQQNVQTPKNKTTRRNIEDIEKGVGEMNSKIKQINIQTPPRPTARKIETQNKSNFSASENIDFNSNTLWRQLFFKSIRRFHSLGSMITYFYAMRKYRAQIEKGELLFCGNPLYDLDVISHAFQYICYFITALFFAVCIYHSDSQTSYITSICVVIVLTVILNIIFLYLDLKYQKMQIKDLQSTNEVQVWEQIAIQQDKNNQEMINNNNQGHIIIEPTPTNIPPQSKRNIPQPPSKNAPQSSRRGDWKRPNSGISTYPIQCENNGNNVNINQQIVGAEDSHNNVQQGNKNIVVNSFQNQSSNINHTTQLNRDSSKSSGVHSIGQPPVESNNRVISPTDNTMCYDIKDEVQILLREKINPKQQKFHGFVFLITILLGGIGGYLLFNTNEMIGGTVILTCFFVALADFIARYIICFSISVVQLVRYKVTKNVEYRKEINEEINWVLLQLSHLERETILLENEFKSPKQNQIIASVKSPSKSVKKIMESLKKIVSPSKKRHQNSPMKDLDEQHDQIQFLPNYNQDNIPIKHLIFNQDGKNGIDFDTQTQHDYSINNVSVNPLMQRINLIKKGNHHNQSNDSIEIQEEIAIKKINMTPASQVKNQYSSKKPEQQPKVKEFVLDSHRNHHIKIMSDRNQNSLRQDSSKNQVNFDDSADTYIDSINLQPEPVKEKNKKKNTTNSRRSSNGQIAPLPSSIVYTYNNTVNQSLNNNNEGEIHSGSLCGKKKSQRSNRSKKDFHTSLEHQNKEFASKNKMLLESTQNDLRSEENIDNSMKPFKAAIDQGYRDSSFIHNRSVNGYDQSHLYTAGDITQMNDQSNILPNNINQKNDGSLLLGEMNQGMQAYVNNTILDPNESINAFRYPTWEKNSTIDNNTIQPPSSAENRYVQDSKERLSAIQTRNIQQQIALKQRREQQLKNKSTQESHKKRNKSEDARMSTSQQAAIHIDNQKKNTLEQNKIDLNDSLDLQNKKISLSVGNFYESPRSKENKFTNKLHKESAINNLISQPQQNHLSYANSLSFLHNQTNNDGTMIMQQQQKDLSIYFNNISDNDNSVQVHPTSPERRKITMKKPLSPIPPTDLKDNDESAINEEKAHRRKKIFETDGEGDEDQQNYNVRGNLSSNPNRNNLLHPYYNVQQIKSFDMNTSEQSFTHNYSGQLSNQQDIKNSSVLNNIEIGDKNLQSKSLSNGKIMKSILEQNKNKENYNLRSYDFDNKQGQGLVQNSNPGSRKNSSQPNVPLKNIVKKKEWEKIQNNSPYLEFLPQMLNNQKDELKEKERELKSKLEKSKKSSRKGSTELSDKIKKVVDNYGYEIQKTEQRNVLVSKKSARSVKSQESKRTLDNKLHEDKEQYEDNQKSILHDNTSNVLNESTNNGLTNQGKDSDNNNNNQSKKSYPHQSHQLMKSKKPPLSSQNNILHKNLMLKENYQQNYPNSARVNLNSIALRQTTTMEGHDMSTMEHNIATQSNHDGFFDRNHQDFVLVRPNNQNSIQFDVANSDRQHNKSFNEEFDFDAFQQYKENDNSLSSFDHSHFGYPKSNKNH